MRINSLTIDDFYANPMEVREFALKQEFKVRGNYPGQRTEPFLTDNTKQKLREINLGKSIPQEIKIKMSKGGVEQYSLDGVLLNTYISLQEAATQTGLYKGNISSACTGRLKTYGGFKWRYKNEDIV